MLTTQRGRLSALAFLLLASLAGACRGRDRNAPLSADSALARDLSLAGAQPAQPALQDTPLPAAPNESRKAPAEVERVPAASEPERRSPAPRPAPRERPRAPVPEPKVAEAPTPQPPSPAPQPAAQPAAPAPEPAPTTGTIASGTSIGLTMDERACSDGGRPGDKMVARLSESVTGTNGVVFPAGSFAVVEIATVSGPADGDTATLTFRVKSITVNDVTHFVTGDVIPLGTLERHTVAKEGSGKKVAGGAVAGAILGAIISRGAKGAVIGAATGAAAGTVAARASVRYESCLPKGATLRLTLTQPIVVAL